MSGGRACDQPNDQCRAGPDDYALLDIGVPALPDERSLYRQHYRRISRWEHEAILEKMQDRLDRTPNAMRVRRQTVEHTFGTLKAWMGATHFLTKTLPKVKTEMSLHVLAYNLKRVMRILGIQNLIMAMEA